MNHPEENEHEEYEIQVPDDKLGEFLESIGPVMLYFYQVPTFCCICTRKHMRSITVIPN